jgi:hypothetical protein
VAYCFLMVKDRVAAAKNTHDAESIEEVIVPDIDVKNKTMRIS